jgi:transcriptional regulator with XRE-family HTH domain
MEIDLKIFGARLREIRQERTLTQEQLGTLLGASRTWITDLETNKQRGLSADTVVRFARALECSADYLLGLTDDPRPRPRKRRPPAAPKEEAA